MRKLFVLALSILVYAPASSAFANGPYNASAGVSAPPAVVAPRVEKQADGSVREVMETKPVARDSYGNAAGSNHDLAVDGAFDGQTVAVIQLYTGTDQGWPFDFKAPTAALKEKGFSVYRWSNGVPSPKELASALEKSNQLWIISGDHTYLTAEHIAVIKKFFDAGHGLYIWGDNAPYNGDANLVAQAVIGKTMVDEGSPGQQVLHLQPPTDLTKPGILPNHLITTGLEFLYEGHTVSILKDTTGLTPLIVGSDGKVVTAAYDHDGKRAVLDGGFTRLYMEWKSAGTGRYVKNAAAWLANYERFGAKVVATSKPQPSTVGP
jgi:hypothetical protein